jgi:hypothetical protein
MTKSTDDITDANEEANKAFNGKQPPANKRPEDAETVTDVNEAADAEFNDDTSKTELGNQVGGLRGSSD